MKITVVNHTTSPVTILNLGQIPASETRTFPVNAFAAGGGFGSERPDIFNQLDSYGLAYEVTPDAHEKGVMGVKKIVVTAADLVAKGAHASAEFTALSAFPAGARYVGGYVDVTTLVNNSDAGFAAGSCLLNVGTDDATSGGDVDGFRASLDVEHGSGSVAKVAFNGAQATILRDLSGLTLYCDIANSAGTALLNETTAGAFTIECLYVVL